MKSWPRYTFIGVYAAAGVLFLLELANLAGLYTTLLTRVMIITGWVCFCFTGHHWSTGVVLFNRRVRKTILEEEQWLHPLMHELNLRTGLVQMPELLILEEPEPDAFATGRNTIVLSRGLLVRLTEQEIKAVLAHEYGHLRQGDTMAATAFSLASTIPGSLYNWLSKLAKQRRKKTRYRPTTVVTLAGILLLFGFHFPDLFLLTIILFIFMKVFPYVNSFVTAGWAYFTRENEFRQDRFAQSLGWGKHLKSALLKIDSLQSENLVTRKAGLWASHPMLYARVRRLEWLEGQRATP